MGFIHNLLFDIGVAVLRVTKTRDRLRCPKCGAVGTWKPHGDSLDRGDTRKVPRWMCKWCGHYRGPAPDNQTRVVPTTNGYWDFGFEAHRQSVDLQVPGEVLENHYKGQVWPWRG